LIAEFIELFDNADVVRLEYR